ncbi:MAG: peptide ABC transporter substrate-binding protein [Anaerolineae bacterium]|nr:peptide ABC transporter substrate-binding protein [Anaerolineae bacterium]MCX8067666.1 peptide ABC transporter substrate-binding protein [Anaerolineae bacterium]MDW7992386.1 peptide ABC transporter substrate-binding protein [Anaerolineae bacterium]
MPTLHRQALVIAAGLALAGIFLVYLAFTYTTVTVPAQGGAYVEGIAGFPYAINPLLVAYSEADRDVASLVFSGLTRLNSQGEVEPDLALRWEISLDGLTYVFHLRPGVRWHDGAPLTADDVLFTVRMLQDPDSPVPPDLRNLWSTVQVVKEDDLTVRFVLSEPFAPFLDYTTIGLLPAHVLENVPAAELSVHNFNLHPVGTGPFQVEAVEQEGEIQSILLRAAPSYYGPRPYLDRVRFRFYPSDQSAFRAYRAGEVEGVAQIPLEILPQARQERGLNLYSAPIARQVLIFLNLGKKEELPFFQQKEVRQALMYGLDRQALVDNLLQGQALVAHSPVLAGTWAYYEGIHRYEYAPALAGALLEGAGWILTPGSPVRMKGEQRLAFTLLVSTDPLQIAVAQEVARQWATMGIAVSIETAAPLEVQQALERREYQAALVELTLPGHPDPYPFWHQTQITGGQNYAGLDHRRISEVLETARITVDPNRQKEFYREFQELFADEVPAILLYQPVYTYGVGQKVQGVQIGPLMYPSDRLRTISSWYIATRRTIVSQAERGK